VAEVTRTLTIAIEAGPHTCRAAADGPWCPFVRTYLYAGRATCALFGKTLPEVNYDGSPSTVPAWLGRLPECIAAEEK
jgi:hypothetical protein